MNEKEMIIEFFKRMDYKLSLLKEIFSIKMNLDFFSGSPNIEEIKSQFMDTIKYLEKNNRIDELFTILDRFDEKKIEWENCKSLFYEENDNTIKYNLLLITIKELEFNAIYNKMKPCFHNKNIKKLAKGSNTYYLGRFSKYPSILLRCDAGSVGRDAIINAINETLKFFTIKAIIMVGFAFGVNKEKQNIGDILVSTQLYIYEPQRVQIDKKIYRGPRPESGKILKNRFQNCQSWRFISEGKELKPIYGPILSGEKLIDNKQFKEELLLEYPEAIGGEMEGAGLYSAASNHNIEWILVKAICDFGEKKDKKYQDLAANTASEFTYYVLSDKSALKSLGIDSIK
jgi:nucleoside phosphorylase